jgi:hypothetical protein
MSSSALTVLVDRDDELIWGLTVCHDVARQFSPQSALQKQVSHPPPCNAQAMARKTANDPTNALRDPER